jgi:3-oxoacid CoA-transferase
VDRAKGGLTLVEIAPGVDIDGIRRKTDADFVVTDNVQAME